MTAVFVNPKIPARDCHCGKAMTRHRGVYVCSWCDSPHIVEVPGVGYLHVDLRRRRDS